MFSDNYNYKVIVQTSQSNNKLVGRSTSVIVWVGAQNFSFLNNNFILKKLFNFK